MKPLPSTKAVGVEIGLHVSWAHGVERLAEALAVLRSSGGELHTYSVESHAAETTAFFLCERPEAAALALQAARFAVETRTVVTVRGPSRPNTLSHLTATLEADGVPIHFRLSVTAADRLLVVLETGDNAKAEELLRAFLFQPVRYPLGPLEAPGGLDPFQRPGAAPDHPAKASS